MTPARTLAAALAAVVLTATPSDAHAGIWAGISGGAYLPGGTAPPGALESGPMAALAVGYDDGYWGASVWAGFLSTRAGVNFQEDAFPILLRARARLPLGVVVPFAFGGVGIAPARSIYLAGTYNAVPFAAQAGGGVDLVFGDMFTIGAEGGWLWLTPSYAWGSVDLSGPIVLATFAVRFP
ncbi:MAG TPA: hypothetical protein PLL32_10470 [Anaeromyxobacteraceae bacterium]|nr:hypothetical protein [Anaeromyxobacteraceae bacterium]